MWWRDTDKVAVHTTCLEELNFKKLYINTKNIHLKIFMHFELTVLKFSISLANYYSLTEFSVRLVTIFESS